jgi:N-acetylglucosaminyldiphosphoundecaprenol N-acetyl-beta-D-mannosaminyltransferase
VMACGEDAELQDAVQGADFTVPDGQPLVWAMNMLGHDLSSRVYGPDLMEHACARAARTGQRFYLYGGRNQGALVELARMLRLRHPGLQIVGGYAPPFRTLTEREEADIAADIERCRPDVVWVGIGVPKQEKWMARMRPRLSAPVLIGVGAAFDFHAGLVPQAPAWMQRLGLEWAFRLAQEPRRLWRRYLRYNPRFVAGFAREYVGYLRSRQR